MSKNKVKIHKRILPTEAYDLLDPGSFRQMDAFSLKAVASSGGLFFYCLAGGGAGTLLKMPFINGRGWNDQKRSEVLSRLQDRFKNESETSGVDFSFSFHHVRRVIDREEVDELKKKFDSDPRRAISRMRVEDFITFSERMVIQKTDLYLGIVATPRASLVADEVGTWKGWKGSFSAAQKTENDLILVRAITSAFVARIKGFIASLAPWGITTHLPKSAQELMRWTKNAWRPNHTQRQGVVSKGSSQISAEERLLLSDAFKTPSDYIMSDLAIEQLANFWISDDSFNMIFAMEQPPNSDKAYSSIMTDKLLTLGVQEGISIVPYYGSFHVLFSPLSYEEGDTKWRTKIFQTMTEVKGGKGLKADIRGEKAVSRVRQNYNSYISDGSNLVKASVLYQLSIPLPFLKKMVDWKDRLSVVENIKSIQIKVENELNSIGDSRWEVVKKQQFSTYMGLVPGGTNIGSAMTGVPFFYTPLDCLMHLAPVFSVVGPDQANFNGSNYFCTDACDYFVFDQFSKSNGAASNMVIIGATGSGKSVTAQILAAALEQYDPNIMIMDFGGGNVGSWDKLCSIMGGVKISFGDADSPIINPFELSEKDAIPTHAKAMEIATKIFGSASQKNISKVSGIFGYLRGNDITPLDTNQTIFEALCKKFPEIEARFKDWDDLYPSIQLGPGTSRPGETGMESLKTLFTILLSPDIDQEGHIASPWGMFNQDDIVDVILDLYNDFVPSEPGFWPTLTDFKNKLLETQKRRRTTKAADLLSGGRAPIENFERLFQRISNFCQGGADAFFDGQTNVPYKIKKENATGVQSMENARFILADFAGVEGVLRKSVYMIITNELMSRICYSSRERRSVIIRDEAWIFLQSEICRPYIKADLRLARKYNFSVVTITQNYSDIKMPEIQANTQIWIVCKLGSEEEIAAANTRFHFNGAELELFRKSGGMGTHIEKDVMNGGVIDASSRIMIRTESGKYFVKNRIGTKLRWVTTTDPDETFIYNYFRGKMKQKTPAEVIDWLATREYYGDVELQKLCADRGMKFAKL